VIVVALISDLSIYTTLSGRLVFMHGQGSVDQKPIYYGYILELSDGRVVRRELAWKECGTCLSSRAEGDRIVRKV
jgi:hypothetical protein